MATNEEYLDNLLKAFEEEEKAREKDVRIPQEKTIITDNDDINSLLNEEIMPINADEIETVSEDIADLMSMLEADALAEDAPAAETASEDIADLMSMLEADALAEDAPAAETASEDIAALMSMLEAENASVGSADDLLSMLSAENLEEQVGDSKAEEFGSDSGNEWASDLDALLAAAVDNLDENQDFFGEGNSEAALSDDMDITQLIDGLGNADESLSEISELLKMSDNNEMLDSFAESEDAIRELTQDDNSKKKNSRLLKKGRKGKAEAEKNEEAVSDKDIKEKKAAGAFGQFFRALLEDEEDETSTDADVSVDENEDLLKQLDSENKKENKKKEKKEKKKKDKKGKKGKKDGANPEEGDDDNLEGEEEGKSKKKKKREKKQKEKAEVTTASNEKSKKVLSRKAFMVFVAFCASLVSIIVCLSAFLPDFTERNHAREAFYQGNYEEAYVLLYGKNLNDSDRLIFDRVAVVLRLERKLEAFYFNDEAGEAAKALDALLQGVSYYQELPDKNVFGAGDELKQSYQKVLDVLSQKYGVDEAKALEVIACDDIRYSQWIYSVAEGIEFEAEEEEMTKQEAEPKGPQNILPEEEAIINTEIGN